MISTAIAHSPNFDVPIAAASRRQWAQFSRQICYPPSTPRDHPDLTTPTVAPLSSSSPPTTGKQQDICSNFVCFLFPFFPGTRSSIDAGNCFLRLTTTPPNVGHQCGLQLSDLTRINHIPSNGRPSVFLLVFNFPISQSPGPMQLCCWVTFDNRGEGFHAPSQSVLCVPPYFPRFSAEVSQL